MFELKLIECQANLEDLLSVGRTFFKKKTGDNIIGSGLKAYTGNGDYDKDGNLKRNGGGPPPNIVHDFNSADNESEKSLEEV